MAQCSQGLSIFWCTFFSLRVLRTQYTYKVILLRLALLSLLFQLSWQQKDPVNDFCRRFGHQTAVIDRKLYIDGGLVNWNPLQQYPQNYTNTWLLYNDIDVISGGMPQIHELSKNASVPDVSGGILWADDINKRFYLFGGDYNGISPDDFNLFSYDAINNYWVSFGPPASRVTRVSWGAGVAISERGEGYYYGGWMSNASVPDWSGGPLTTSNMIKYDMDNNVWTNSSGPDSVPRAEGVMVYIPASDGGMLIYFGGIAAPYANSTMIGMPMSTILVYDIAGSRWYNQTATGAVPNMRRRFCAGATWAQDQSSYNVYLYGGAGVSPDDIGFDDVYILSIPSFTWIKWYPSDNSTGNPHGWSSCNVINNAQMIIIGGTFPISQNCDAQAVWGTHNLDLGKQNNDSAMWYTFQPSLTTYAVPTEIVAIIGGSSLGGATLTTPAAGWGNRDLPILMTRKATIAARTATRNTSPTSSSAPTTTTPKTPPITPHDLSTGAIAGIAVGGAIALIALLLGCGCFLRHRRRRLRAGATSQPASSPQPPVSQVFEEYGQYSPHAHASIRPDVISPVELSGQPAPDASPPTQHYSFQQGVQDIIVQPKHDDPAIHHSTPPPPLQRSTSAIDYSYHWPMPLNGDVVQRQYSHNPSEDLTSRSPSNRLEAWEELSSDTMRTTGYNSHAHSNSSRYLPAPQYTSIENCEHPQPQALRGVPRSPVAGWYVGLLGVVKLFLDGPKIIDSPYRWAPYNISLSRDQMQRTCFLPLQMRGIEEMGTQFPADLIIDLPGFLFSTKKPVEGTEFFAFNKTTAGQRLLYIHTVAESGYKAQNNEAVPEVTFIPETNPADGFDFIVGAVLLLASLDAPMPGHRQIKSSHVEGLVISDVEAIDTASGQIIQERREAHVKVFDTNSWLGYLESYPRAEMEKIEGQEDRG